MVFEISTKTQQGKSFNCFGLKQWWAVVNYVVKLLKSSSAEKCNYFKVVGSWQAVKLLSNVVSYQVVTVLKYCNNSWLLNSIVWNFIFSYQFISVWCSVWETCVFAIQTEVTCSLFWGIQLEKWLLYSDFVLNDLRLSGQSSCRVIAK